MVACRVLMTCRASESLFDKSWFISIAIISISGSFNLPTSFLSSLFSFIISFDVVILFPNFDLSSSMVKSLSLACCSSFLYCSLSSWYSSLVAIWEFINSCFNSLISSFFLWIISVIFFVKISNSFWLEIVPRSFPISQKSSFAIFFSLSIFCKVPIKTAVWDLILFFESFSFNSEFSVLKLFNFGTKYFFALFTSEFLINLSFFFTSLNWKCSSLWAFELIFPLSIPKSSATSVWSSLRFWGFICSFRQFCFPFLYVTKFKCAWRL